MDEEFLNREKSAAYVRDKGLPCTKATLAKLACIGGGPKFRKFGRNVVYTAPDLHAWIEARLTDPVAHTSDRVPPNGKPSTDAAQTGRASCRPPAESAK